MISNFVCKLIFYRRLQLLSIRSNNYKNITCVYVMSYIYVHLCKQNTYKTTIHQQILFIYLYHHPCAFNHTVQLVVVLH